MVRKKATAADGSSTNGRIVAICGGDDRSLAGMGADELREMEGSYCSDTV